MPARINGLIEDVLRDPFAGIGRPEPLKCHLPGAGSSSRRPAATIGPRSWRAVAVLIPPRVRASPEGRPAPVRGGRPSGVSGAGGVGGRGRGDGGGGPAGAVSRR
ncbi:type II toxin-antitoxin system YoeB family toxin [Kitasatospora sp. NPDC056327]|uniref:type II toxin-antitoxin system YoeB family toxin n=1 Tax=Kitasatospora sp. NPDC056327 TaxID=3345785 RepID=UPI0035DC1289